MKELFETLVRKPYEMARGFLLLDTCFIIDLAEKRQLHHLTEASIAMTSFNLEELEHVAHKLSDTIKHELRSFFKKHPRLVILDVDVHPGQPASEKAFVASIEPELLKHVPDPSDAVLAAVALATKSNLLTKDKRHLFNVEVENLFTARGVHVWKEWKDAQDKQP
ncbi:PIN domain-containing protein [Candidatus Woesearchaeota archaeon]|nr:PIN domain-containing protein [Candidatus Woesearchaeota archaeon]